MPTGTENTSQLTRVHDLAYVPNWHRTKDERKKHTHMHTQNGERQETTCYVFLTLCARTDEELHVRNAERGTATATLRHPTPATEKRIRTSPAKKRRNETKRKCEKKTSDAQSVHETRPFSAWCLVRLIHRVKATTMTTATTKDFTLH